MKSFVAIRQLNFRGSCKLLPGSREKRTRLVICVIAGGSFFRPTALQQGNQAFGVSDLAALCLQVLYLGTQVHISDVILATGNLAWNALTIEERFDLFRSARTSCTNLDPLLLLLLLIIPRGWPFANDNPEGPASCK